MKIHTEKGSIKRIILLIIAIALASYFFDFSVQEVVEHEQTQSNYSYIKNHVVNFYQNYLHEPIRYLWDQIIVDLLWNPFVESLGDIKSGEPHIFEKAANNLKIEVPSE